MGALLVKAQDSTVIFKDYEHCTYGVLSSNGDTLVSPKYTLIHNPYEGTNLSLVFEGAYQGILNIVTGQLIVPTRFQSIEPIFDYYSNRNKRTSQSFFFVKQNELWGFYKANDGWLIKPSFYSANNYLSYDKLVVQGKPGKWLVLETNGNLSDTFYTKFGISLHKNYVKQYVSNNSMRLYSFEAKPINNSVYIEFKNYPQHYVWYRRVLADGGQRQGILKPDGSLLIEADSIKLKRSALYYYNDKCIETTIVEKGQRLKGVLDTSNYKWLFEPKFRKVDQINGGEYFIFIDQQGKYSFYDNIQKKYIVEGAEQLYYLRTKVSHKIIYLLNNKIYTWTNQNNSIQKVIRAKKLLVINHSLDHHLFYKRKKQWFLLDTISNEGKYIADSIYPIKSIYAPNYELWMATRNKDQKWGVLSESLDTLVPFEYSQFYQPHLNVLLLSNAQNRIKLFGNFTKVRDRKWPHRMVIDYHSIDLKYLNDELYSFRDNASNYKYGAVNFDNQTVLAPEFDTIRLFDESTVYVVAHDRSKGLYSMSQNKYVVPLGFYKKIELKEREGLYRVVDENKVQYFDSDGSEKVDYANYVDIESFGDMGLAVALDTFKVGIISREGEWLLNPNYCAVEAYNEEQKIASVRACPISAFSPSEYWNEPNIPTEGQWGIIDSFGNWLIPPKSLHPLDVYADTLIVSDGSYNWMYTIKGELIWKDSLTSIQKVENYNHLYLVRDEIAWGIRSVSGEQKIACQFDELVITDSGYVGYKYSKGVAISYFDENFKETKIKGNALNKAFFEKYASFEIHLKEQLKDVEKLNPLENWLYAYYVDAILPNDLESFDPSSAQYETELSDYGFCHPQYRLPVNESTYYPYYRYDETEYYFELIENKFGASFILNTSTCNLGTRGPAYCFSEFAFINVNTVNGEKVETYNFWQVLDSTKCKQLLNDSILSFLRRENLDVNCARNGDYTYLAKESFTMTKDAIYIYISNGKDNEYEGIEYSYDVLKLPFTNWAKYFIKAK